MKLETEKILNNVSMIYALVFTVLFIVFTQARNAWIIFLIVIIPIANAIIGLNIEKSDKYSKWYGILSVLGFAICMTCQFMNPDIAAVALVLILFPSVLQMCASLILLKKSKK
ncbi:hypothetical protein [Floccifex sp.]|nr:hypothetical protein [Erysipelotrichaceae bacterium]